MELNAYDPFSLKPNVLPSPVQVASWSLVEYDRYTQWLAQNGYLFSSYEKQEIKQARMRIRNRLAAGKSRSKTKEREYVLKQRVAQLELENEILREKIRAFESLMQQEQSSSISYIAVKEEPPTPLCSDDLEGSFEDTLSF